MLNLTFALLVIFLAQLIVTGSNSQEPRGRFDRLAVLEHFLDLIYPDLSPVHGLILARSEELHFSKMNGLQPLQVDLIPCRLGSGVPGAGQEMAVPHCTGLFPKGLSEFLNLSISYSDAFPIGGFQAQGSFVNARSEATKQEIWDHPEWGRPEWTEAVLRAHPRFGPAQKQEFIQSIRGRTINVIREFTGCRLDLGTASFWVDRLGNKPDPMHVEIQWSVKGRKLKPSKESTSCSAAFEPFEGKLLSVNGM